jgi:hypothetical protein
VDIHLGGEFTLTIYMPICMLETASYMAIHEFLCSVHLFSTTLLPRYCALINLLGSGSFEKENFAWVDQARTGGTVVSRRMRRRKYEHPCERARSKGRSHHARTGALIRKK